MKYLPKNHKQNKKLRMSAEDLQQIMDSEFAKPMDEMDVDLIVLCSDILHARHNHENKDVKPHSPKKAIIRIFAIAAVISIVAATFLFSFADTSEKRLNFNHVTMESYKNDAMVLNLQNMDMEPDGYFLKDSELLSRLKGSGIEPLLLPEVFFDKEYELYEIKGEYRADDERMVYRNLFIKFVKYGVSGDIIIRKDFSQRDRTGLGEHHMNVTGADEFIVNGMDVILLERKNGAFSIMYHDSTQNTSYDITVYGTYDQAKEILQSIK